MKRGKYLVASVVGLWPKVEVANTIKSALRKGKVDKSHTDGKEFMLFKAVDGEIVRINRSGKER